MSVRILVDGEPVTVTLTRTGDAIVARVGDAEYRGTARRDGDVWRFELGARPRIATVVRERDELWVSVDGEVYRCAPAAEERGASDSGATRSPRVTAPMPGKVLDVVVREGQHVAAGDPLVILEAMKMETIATADADGTVTRVHVTGGSMVEPGQPLVDLRFDEAS